MTLLRMLMALALPRMGLGVFPAVEDSRVLIVLHDSACATAPRVLHFSAFIYK